MNKQIISVFLIFTVILSCFSVTAEESKMQLVDFKTETSGTVKGEVSNENGLITLTTNGVDAWGTQDSLSEYLTVTPVMKTGSSEKVVIQATVNEMRGEVQDNSSTGIVLRSDKNGDGVNVMLRVTSYGGIRLTYRPIGGERTNYEPGADVQFPVTLRLEYENQTVTAYYLKNGRWINTCKANIDLGNQIYGGVGAFSSDINSKIQASYKDFKFGLNDASFEVIPQEETENTFGEWIKSTYTGGGAAVEDDADYTDGIYTIKTNARNAWGMEDNMTAVIKKETLSFTRREKSKVIIEATFDSLVPQSEKNNIDGGASAGIIFRAEDRADAANVMVRVLPSGGIRFTYRDVKGAKTSYQAIDSPAFPITLKLERQGNIINGFYKSSKGWEKAGSIELDLGNTMYAGFGAFSNDALNGVISKISNVSLKKYDGYIPTDNEETNETASEEYLLKENFADKNLKNNPGKFDNPTWIACENNPSFEEDEHGTVWLSKSGVKGTSYVGGIKWTDYEVTADFKMNGASAENIFEFIVRARPNEVTKLRGAYYYSFSIGTKNWRLMTCVSYMVNNNTSVVNRGALAKNYNDGNVHHLKIIAMDNKISVFLDDEAVGMMKDEHVFKNLWGCIGIKTSGENVKFSNIKVKKIKDELGGDYDNFLQGAFDSPIQSYYDKIEIPEE